MKPTEDLRRYLKQSTLQPLTVHRAAIAWIPSPGHRSHRMKSLGGRPQPGRNFERILKFKWPELQQYIAWGMYYPLSCRICILIIQSTVLDSKVHLSPECQDPDLIAGHGITLRCIKSTGPMFEYAPSFEPHTKDIHGFVFFTSFFCECPADLAIESELGFTLDL